MKRMEVERESGVKEKGKTKTREKRKKRRRQKFLRTVICILNALSSYVTVDHESLVFFAGRRLELIPRDNNETQFFIADVSRYRTRNSASFKGTRRLWKYVFWIPDKRVTVAAANALSGLCIPREAVAVEIRRSTSATP